MIRNSVKPSTKHLIQFWIDSWWIVQAKLSQVGPKANQTSIYKFMDLHLRSNFNPIRVWMLGPMWAPRGAAKFYRSLLGPGWPSRTPYKLLSIFGWMMVSVWFNSQSICVSDCWFLGLLVSLSICWLLVRSLPGQIILGTIAKGPASQMDIYQTGFDSSGSYWVLKVDGVSTNCRGICRGANMWDPTAFFDIHLQKVWLDFTFGGNCSARGFKKWDLITRSDTWTSKCETLSKFLIPGAQQVETLSHFLTPPV